MPGSGLSTRSRSGRSCASASIRKLRGETVKVAIAGRSVWLLKPITFMNASGASVCAALRYWKIEPEEMLVVAR